MTNVNVKNNHHSYSTIKEDDLPSVDLSIPIILAQINPIIEYSVIDGRHQIEKAYPKLL
jgi:hypothetical protein